MSITMHAAPLRPITAFFRLVTIEHSIFALPFAYLAALVAMRPGINWGDLGLITIAMIGARTFAMAVNRIIDRHIDARNPRTAGRELVTGAISLRTAWIGAVIALGVFLVASAALNTLCLILAPVAVIPLIVYPYAKRFTDFPHAILAGGQLIGPVGAWLAVTGTFTGSAPAWILGAGVGLWIGGFDLIYACQDAEIDRIIGVRSIPARFGIRVALHTSTVLHIITFILYAYFGFLMEFGLIWWLGMTLAAFAFIYEHAIISPHDISKVNRSFFTVNGFIGIALFFFAGLDLVSVSL